MAGPTPVSALIHAATMVTAGVYLVARLSGIYVHAPEASAIVAAIGVATAFFAATIAVVQTDIKKVLAYSTISQLGLMFVALGVGAYGVAIFHLYTHAFFKACLFLGAGSVIHALGGEQDIRKMGGLARKIPITFVTFAVATAAIAGIPRWPASSRRTKSSGSPSPARNGGSPLLYVIAAGTSLLTAFYMFRLLWLTFFGPSRMTPETEHHVHESPPSMTGILVVLAVLSAIGGFVSIPHYLAPLLPAPEVPHELEHLESTLILVSVAIAFAGLIGAAFMYGGDAERATRMQRRLDGLHRLLSGKYWVDEAYDLLITRPLYWISDRLFLQTGDRKLLDGTLNGMAALAQRTAGLMGRVQNGSLHLYALFVVLGIVASIAWSWRHG